MKNDKGKEEKFCLDGTVLEVLPEGKFRVAINVAGNEHVLICYQSGKMRMHYIKIIVGDKVKLEISKYDVTKGRIILRY
jgi:translation initiation factor IF-1